MTTKLNASPAIPRCPVHGQRMKSGKVNGHDTFVCREEGCGVYVVGRNVPIEMVTGTQWPDQKLSLMVSQSTVPMEDGGTVPDFRVWLVLDEVNAFIELTSYIDQDSGRGLELNQHNSLNERVHRIHLAFANFARVDL